MGNLLLLDIDGTLFDAEEFGRLIRKSFIKILNIDEEELISANADYYSELESPSDFDPRGISEFLAARYNYEKAALDRVFWEEDEIFKNSLFEESINVVGALSKTRTLGVFSQGNEDLQKRKITASGLEKYFNSDYMFFHRRKTSDDAIELLPKESTVVDDNHDVVTKIGPFVKAIWINRRTEDNDPKIKTIHNLKELLI